MCSRILHGAVALLISMRIIIRCPSWPRSMRLPQNLHSVLHVKKNALKLMTHRPNLRGNVEITISDAKNVHIFLR